MPCTPLLHRRASKPASAASCKPWLNFGSWCRRSRLRLGSSMLRFWSFSLWWGGLCAPPAELAQGCGQWHGIFLLRCPWRIWIELTLTWTCSGRSMRSQGQEQQAALASCHKREHTSLLLPWGRQSVSLVNLHPKLWPWRPCEPAWWAFLLLPDIFLSLLMFSCGISLELGW